MPPETAALAADAPVLAALAQARDGGALGRDDAIALLATPSLTGAPVVPAAARRRWPRRRGGAHVPRRQARGRFSRLSRAPRRMGLRHDRRIRRARLRG